MELHPRDKKQKLKVTERKYLEKHKNTKINEK